MLYQGEDEFNIHPAALDIRSIHKAAVDILNH